MTLGFILFSCSVFSQSFGDKLKAGLLEKFDQEVEKLSDKIECPEGLVLDIANVLNEENLKALWGPLKEYDNDIYQAVLQKLPELKEINTQFTEQNDPNSLGLSLYLIKMFSDLVERELTQEDFQLVLSILSSEPYNLELPELAQSILGSIKSIEIIKESNEYDRNFGLKTLKINITDAADAKDGNKDGIASFVIESFDESIYQILQSFEISDGATISFQDSNRFYWEQDTTPPTNSLKIKRLIEEGELRELEGAGKYSKKKYYFKKNESLLDDLIKDFSTDLGSIKTLLTEEDTLAIQNYIENKPSKFPPLFVTMNNFKAKVKLEDGSEYEPVPDQAILLPGIDFRNSLFLQTIVTEFFIKAQVEVAL